jgi:glycosyltransferase involved in cell wall biosynthesis
MAAFTSKKKILFLSTFPPKKCGIASFTSDLVRAINAKLTGSIIVETCALDKESNSILYKYPVTRIMNARNLDSCIETAIDINEDDNVKLICIEHEFGLYGGELGEYLLGFLSMLEKPFIIRFHTMLSRPSPKMLGIVKSIALLAVKVIVMTKHSARVIKEDYGVSAAKIIIIPHGTHASSIIDKEELKAKYDFQNKQVLTTFGLLSPNKGIEKGILAMKEISVAFPDALYIVVGQTHPNLLEQEGEKYHDYLQQLITDNGLQENVRLINEYVPTKKLMEYLALTDIYLFTSKDPEQAVSGTFLYAMSAGCPIISNSFVLAKEMLDEKTGVILTSANESELAGHAIRILKDPQLKKEMGANALMKTRNTTWEKIGERHISLFNEILPATVLKEELPGVISLI